MTTLRIPFRAGAVALAAATLAACGGGGDKIELSVKPGYIGFVDERTYDASNDLLTAGLGAAGLAGAAPTVSATPTAAELRRLAIYNNYRAIVDVSPNGGYGRLFGPTVPLDGMAMVGDGRIPGTESITYADDGTGRQNVVLMVQVPTSFDPARPCIVTGTSSGSRGIYGAIGSSGEWGLKRGCAVAYTDKGSGNGVHDLQNDTVNLIDGTRTTASNAGRLSHFTANLTSSERQAFNAQTPNRFAVKHAHSEQNPEKDWGRDTLRAIEFAFWVLNERYSPELSSGGRERRINPANTIVIASSVSNGGGAALAAAEIDRAGWIDGVAVSEPQVQLQTLETGTLRIQRGSLPPLPVTSRSLLDYTTFANLLQPCAALATGAAGGPGAGFLNATLAANRCAALAANRLVSGTTLAEQAADALARLQTYGWEPESNPLHTSHYLFATPAIATTYANTYGRFKVTDNLCGYSFGQVDAAFAPVAATPTNVAAIFGTGNGVPPSGWLTLINNASVGGPRQHAAAVSASTGLADYSFDAAQCQRELATGATPNAARVRTGVGEVLRNANLGGKPAIIVHGRADTLVPANFSSRPYFGRNQQVEGANSRLRYIEVTNAQHFDSFLNPANFLAGYDTRYVPLHVYFNRAMDAMWAHLTAGTPLPDSQVVRTTPRGGTPGAAPALAAENVPPIRASVPEAERIRLDAARSTLIVPD